MLPYVGRIPTAAELATTCQFPTPLSARLSRQVSVELHASARMDGPFA